MKDNAAPAPVKVGAVDIEAFAKNLARMVEEGGKALAAYMKPREEGQVQAGLSDEMNDMVKTLGEVGSYWLSDPSRAAELQSQLGRAYLDLWGAAAVRRSGRTGRHARSEGPPLCRSGMVVEPVLRLHQAGLSAQHPLG
jgi:polyhydroxyalkanoate synthase